ncbi:hypothetical protein, partial [Sphingomonas sp.]|uniref:hypothetical protein n=1 Tax=Sphingomonas sp. TaxID=28214 RepID=UPI00325FB2F4
MTKEKPAVLVPVRVVESRLERDGEPSLLANVLPKPDGIPEASGSRLPLPGKLTQSLTQFPLVSDFTTQYQLLTESRPTQNRVLQGVSVRVGPGAPDTTNRSGRGGIGRRAGFKIPFRKECGFDS